MLRDGGYAIRELAFNNRLQGCVTNIFTTTNGTVTILQGKADQLLQQLFSLVQAVETSPQVEQTERARAARLYLQYCLVNTNAYSSDTLNMILSTNKTNQSKQP